MHSNYRCNGMSDRNSWKTIDKNANYILQVKSNQQYLKDQLEDIFNGTAKRKIDEQCNLEHGRIEHRKCEVVLVNDVVFDGKENWKNLFNLVWIESKRTIKNKY